MGVRAHGFKSYWKHLSPIPLSTVFLFLQNKIQASPPSFSQCNCIRRSTGKSCPYGRRGLYFHFVFPLLLFLLVDHVPITHGLVSRQLCRQR